MGGQGSGGRRTGSGRQRTSDLEHAISGTVSTAIAAPVSTAVGPLASVDPPTEAQLAPRLAALRLMLEALWTGRAPGVETRADDGTTVLQERVAEMQTQAAEALAVWHELAPHAVAKRTLTPGTAAVFLMLCRAVVTQRYVEPGGANDRGMQQRIASWMKDFAIGPLGKPEADTAPPAAVNPLDRFTKARP